MQICEETKNFANTESWECILCTSNEICLNSQAPQSSLFLKTFLTPLGSDQKIINLKRITMAPLKFKFKLRSISGAWSFFPVNIFLVGETCSLPLTWSPIPSRYVEAQKTFCLQLWTTLTWSPIPSPSLFQPQSWGFHNFPFDLTSAAPLSAQVQTLLQYLMPSAVCIF